MARLESVRALIALSVQQALKLHRVDVITAFLNGELEEEVYMKQPEGFVVPGVIFGPSLSRILTL